MKKILNVFAILMITLLLFGCGNSKTNIVGTWESPAGLGKFTFNKDGTGSQEAMGLACEIKYTIEDNKLTIVYQNQGIEYQAYYEYVVEDKQLKLAEVNNETSNKTYVIFDKVVEDNKENPTGTELTKDKLKDIYNNLSKANAWAEFRGYLYVDYNAEPYKEGEYTYYPIVCEGVSNLNDVKGILSKSYSSKVVEETLDTLGHVGFIEKDGKLYIKEPGGIGGVPEPIYKISAKANDGGYLVTFHFSGFDEGTGQPNHEEKSSRSYNLIEENGQLVFNEIASIGFGYTLDDCEYVVE